MEFRHRSVLLEETIEGLKVRPDGIYLDGTLGGGGHSSEILRRLQSGHLIGVDQDEEALAAAGKRLLEVDEEGKRFTLIRDNYCNAKEAVRALGYEGADGIVLDLGVSSWQLDNAERGFSYRYDAPLDMRMDTRQTLTARDIVNDYPENALYQVIRDYGEEQFAKNIAKHIVAARQEKPVETTGQLVEIIRAAIPKKVRAVGGHPAKKTFQAIRIELNHELDVLKGHLEEMVDLLGDGGRLCVITFHSLEDRIVKNIFRTCERPCICPPDFPVCTCGRVSKGRVVTRKPIVPGEKELEENSRSKSAKLRVFERIVPLS